MSILEKLDSFGADTKDGVNRCCGMQTFYIDLVKRVPGDENFRILEESVENKDYKAAFEAAHALKGVLGNLSITCMYDKCSYITEKLRGGEDADYRHEVAALLRLRDGLSEICSGEDA